MKKNLLVLLMIGAGLIAAIAPNAFSDASAANTALSQAERQSGATEGANGQNESVTPEEVPSVDTSIQVGCEAWCSPNNRYYILFFMEPNSADYTRRALFVCRETGETVNFCLPVRSIGVLWSPDSKQFLLNDYEGSDFTNCYVYSVPGLRKELDMEKILRKDPDKEYEKLLNECDHIYLEGMQWKDRSLITIKIDGRRSGEYSRVLQIRYDIAKKKIVKKEVLKHSGWEKEKASSKTPGSSVRIDPETTTPEAK